ncbi:MAG: dihydroorotase [Alphaproteobacteria bacterium]|nr:dihydroorotase [Alphaproteobacteria bacterium]
MDRITIPRPDDWHLHFRDGEMLKAVVPYTARVFARAIVMPNLVPPVTTAAMAAAYRERILAAVPDGVTFTPLMTNYLTDHTDAKDMIAGFRAGVFTAAKLYPAHATTNSAHGVSDIAKIYGVLEAMAEAHMPLLVHGEVTHADVDVFDREKRFIDDILQPLMERMTTLRVVMEHITTEDGAMLVRNYPGRMGATITPQHLLYNRNELFRGGVRPHMYCLPILKRERHQLALRKAATNGGTQFFLGTDSAPHLRHLKENACGCAGVFSAPVAIEAYLKVFDEENALQNFEAFASRNGPAFYGMPVNDERVSFARTPLRTPAPVKIAGEGEVVTLFDGESIGWSMVS